MALIDKLKNIGDAIRAETGGVDSLSLDQMAASMKSMHFSLDPAEYPDHIRKEVLRVATRVREIIDPLEDAGDKYVLSLCVSDTHYAPDDNAVSTSGKHALMAMKGLTRLLPFDFIAHLGDVGNEGLVPIGAVPSWAGSRNKTYVIKTTNDKGVLVEETFYRYDGSWKQIDPTQVDMNEHLKKTQLNMVSYLKEVSASHIPLFVTVGNHDSGTYITQLNKFDVMPGEFLYKNLISLSDSADTVFGTIENGGYCYRDFKDKKVRVYLLNSMDDLIIRQNDDGPSKEQRAWFCQSLLDLNKKSDAAEWSFLVLCHYPADYGNLNLANILYTYNNGDTIAVNGKSFDFTSNGAKFLAQYHGHIHNFLQGEIGGRPDGGKQLYRVAVPQTEDYKDRYNYYGSFAEPQAYYKISGQAEDTSFTVNIIDISNSKHYTICYGAGPGEKELDLTGNYWAITYSLSDGLATSSNKAGQVLKGGYSYETYVGLSDDADNHYLSEVKVKMGGIDITSQVYDEITGRVYIDNVTGHITITATALVYNQLQIARTSPKYKEVYGNGKGYIVGKRVSTSSGLVTDTNNAVLTGFIPGKAGDIIRVRGFTIQADRVNYTSAILMFSESAANKIEQYPTSFSIPPALDLHDATYNNGIYTIQVPNDKPGATFWLLFTIQYKPGTFSEDEFIVTINKEIKTEAEGSTFTITNNLDDHVSTSNTSSKIKENASYSSVLTFADEYEAKSVTITMGGQDISSAYSNGKISILVVTGDIEITVVSQVKQKNPNNLIHQSTDANGNIYNGVGWKTDSRINSAGEEVSDYGASGYELTGYIPVKYNDVFEFVGITFPTEVQNKANIAYFDANKTLIGVVNNVSTHYAKAELDANNNVKKITVHSAWSSAAKRGITLNQEPYLVAYMRVTANHIDSNSEIIKI